MVIVKPFGIAMVTAQQRTRFYERVDKTGDCWPWTGTKTRAGYGIILVGPPCGRRKVYAHRLAWMLAHPDEDLGTFLVCHHCDNRPCCRPLHIYRGTPADNALDQFKARRPYPRIPQNTA